MGATERRRVLAEICDAIADQDVARRIRALDPDDDLALVEAYRAIRTLPTVSDRVRSELLEQAYQLIEADDDRSVAEKLHPGDPDDG